MVKRKYWISAIGLIVLGVIAIALFASVGATSAHNPYLTGNPGAVGADSCSYLYTVDEYDRVYSCEHADGCIRIWQETHVPQSGYLLVEEVCPQSETASAQSSGGSAPPPMVAIWLADVCEMDGGFDSYGNMTIDSSANTMPYGRTLYASGSQWGPWTAVSVDGPPYVMTRSAIEALAASHGLSDYRQLWFSASSNGQAALLGSMIANRDGRMADTCNGH